MTTLGMAIVIGGLWIASLAAAVVPLLRQPSAQPVPVRSSRVGTGRQRDR